MPNENCLEGMQCPHCKSEGPFDIWCEAIATVADDGVCYSRDYDWHDESYCACTRCGAAGTVGGFTADGNESSPSDLDFQCSSHEEMFDPFRYGIPVDDMDERARNYLLKNPDVWRLLVEATMRLARSYPKFSIEMVTEVVRHSYVNEDVKFTNSFRPHFGRLLFRHMPERIRSKMTGSRSLVDPSEDELMEL